MLKYPIGIQSFQELIEGKYVYVDKTPDIYQLLQGKYYFLSRPRRFGKSLLLSTLKAIFEGKKHLFEGLYIYDKIEWETHPIIHISFTNVSYQTLGLEAAIHETLDSIAKQYDLELPNSAFSSKFRELIIRLHKKYDKKVVILIDEYDTPIINSLTDDIQKAIENRDILKYFYEPIKNIDDHLAFFFLTGISKFSKVSIFSTLNNLDDISTDERYTSICGWKQDELQHHFGDRIKDIATNEDLSNAVCLEKIKRLYNGFCFSKKGKPLVYNPFSMLLFLSKGEFANYWFQTGTPTFLVKMLRNDFKYDLDAFEVSEKTLESYDLERLDYRAILFQTGYITIKEKVSENIYRMGYPNDEVRASMLDFLLSEYLELQRGDGDVKIAELERHLKVGDIKGLMLSIDQIFATIPYDLFQQHYENFYHAIISMTFRLLGINVKAEVHHRLGAIDAIVEMENFIYIFEFKVNKSAQSALRQIKDNEYHLPYLNKGKKVFLIGVKFTGEKRGVAAWKHEDM
jgi:hypothetical protein